MENQKKNVRVMLRDVRLSFPHLDEPRANAQIAGSTPKYSASFLMEPGSQPAKDCAAAIKEVATAAWGENYARQLASYTSEKQPLHRGDDRPKVYDGYQGMLYLSASNRVQPDLRDANPTIQIRGAQEIREKFLPGYKVNAVVEFWPETKFKNQVCASLVGVQFAGYADLLGGTVSQQCDFPDCSDQVANQSADAFGAAQPQVGEEDVPF